MPFTERKRGLGHTDALAPNHPLGCQDYRHSAGGQFAVRYLTLHPGRLLTTIVSAASAYPSPSDGYNWPMGSRAAPEQIDWA